MGKVCSSLELGSRPFQVSCSLTLAPLGQWPTNHDEGNSPVEGVLGFRFLPQVGFFDKVEGSNCTLW
jgi:hypothetical protein